MLLLLILIFSASAACPKDHEQEEFFRFGFSTRVTKRTI
jgi:hypothetical protein